MNKNTILQNLPYKEEIYNNSEKDFNKFEKYCIIFGKIILKFLLNSDISRYFQKKFFNLSGWYCILLDKICK